MSTISRRTHAGSPKVHDEATRQPGFISTQLHRGIAGNSVCINYAVWESTEHFKRAFTNPEFQAKLKDGMRNTPEACWYIQAKSRTPSGVRLSI